MKSFLRETDQFFAEHMPSTTRSVFYVLVAIYLCMAIIGLALPADLLGRLFVLTPAQAIGQGHVWQFVTYMFSHGSLMHLFSNVLILFFFGGLVEQQMGSHRYLCFLLAAGILGGMAHTAVAYALGASRVGLIGFSAAGFAIITAAVMWFPRMRVLVMFLFPVPLRVLAAVFGILLLTVIVDDVRRDGLLGGGVSHLAHIVGILVAVFLIRNPRLLDRLEDLYIPFLMRRRPRMVSRRRTSMGHPGRHSDPDDLYNDPHWKLDQ